MHGESAVAGAPPRRRLRAALVALAALITVAGVLVVRRGAGDSTRTATGGASTSSSSSAVSTDESTASSTSGTTDGSTIPGDAGSSVPPTTPTTIDDGSLRVEVSPIAPTSGDEVEVTVTLHHALRYDLVGIIDARSYGTFWWDWRVVGGPDDGRYQYADSLSAPCTVPPEPMPEPTTVVFRERFRALGTQHYVVRARHQCDGDELQEAFVDFTFDVSGPGARWNGPRLPTIGFRQQPPYAGGEDGDATAVHLFVYASDADGDVNQVVIDWGDGSAPETMTPSLVATYACDTTMEWGDLFSIFEGNPKHVYATPGTHTVTATATSVGCDGTGEQTTTQTFDAVFPYTEP